jgi:hypothetical protein
MTLYDLPGFFDTRDIKQEILKSYSNAKMVCRGTKAKIIIMVEIGSLMSAKGGTMADIAKRLRQFCNNDFRQIINSCGLIASKINLSEYES